MLASTAVATIFPAVIIAATFILNMRQKNNMEKITPFECGFDPISSARIPFSLQFFILAVVFLVFDIEIALLMPAPLTNEIVPNTMAVILMFCFILLVGLYHEWNEMSLEWT